MESTRLTIACYVPLMECQYLTGLNTIYDSMQQRLRVVQVYVNVPIAILVHNLTWFTQIASPVWPIQPQHIHEGIEIQMDSGGSFCEEK